MTAHAIAPTTAAPTAAPRPGPKPPTGGGGWTSWCATGWAGAAAYESGVSGVGVCAVTGASSFGHDEADSSLQILEHLRHGHPAGQQCHDIGQPDLADHVRHQRVALALGRRGRSRLRASVGGLDDADEQL